MPKSSQLIAQIQDSSDESDKEKIEGDESGSVGSIANSYEGGGLSAEAIRFRRSKAFHQPVMVAVGGPKGCRERHSKKLRTIRIIENYVTNAISIEIKVDKDRESVQLTVDKTSRGEIRVNVNSTLENKDDSSALFEFSASKGNLNISLEDNSDSISNAAKKKAQKSKRKK